MRILICAFLACFLIPSGLVAQEKSFVLSVPQALENSGFLDYLLPRFSLKTSVRIQRAAPGAAADLQLSASGNDSNGGPAVFQGPQILWHIERVSDSPAAARFLTWLASDIGHRTILGYQPDGVSLFTPPTVERVATAPAGAPVDTAVGAGLALTTCGRCHVVNEKNRMNSIGSTPSFALLRTFDDWEERFQSFYARKPHPAYTQIEGVTAPFDPARPPPIVPLRLTPEELDAITDYVATIAPADLGAPLQAQ
ncbi:c-type cytochrome [Candidatus Halocynthiibacter alkanivorans]|uniref:c-type cytochrome n=1 Tax=Candidatus Halocynthiibacter alkanivorans TaxID=2267619 RepID=UPI000DF3D9C7|nr:c-type cytochrome [Candidatus Halocynthiibacter alkanivorans]